MKRVVVFCGSSTGNDPDFGKMAEELGAFLAAQGIGIVYGGASVGLMGAVAHGAMQKGGEVIGVLPQFLKRREIENSHLTQMITVQTMHERKSLMAELCDGAIVLPGGFGTFDEVFELLTWAQLGLHQKPIAFYNYREFYTPLLNWLRQVSRAGFVPESNLKLLLESDSPTGLLEVMNRYEPIEVPQWLKNHDQI